MVAMKDIRALADEIARRLHPQRIILFGSCAAGTAGPDSDVDLLVVIAHAGQSWEVAARIRNFVDPGFPLDLLVRSPGELHRRLSMGDPFFREVVHRGKTLYQADHE